MAVHADTTGKLTAVTGWIRRRRSGVRLATVLGLMTVAALGALSGALGYLAYQGHEDELRRAMFLEVAMQGAMNLTTINHAEADADVRRVLDSATGTFREDFEKRAQPFIEAVRQAQAISQGTVTEAGFESDNDDQAQVLVSVAVTTSTAGSPDPQAQQWRMRITVHKVGDGAKVSNVGFVP